MDRAIQAALIIATFSLAHERFVEFLRWWISKLPSEGARNLLDALTKGAWAWLPAVGLSIATRANVLDAFQLDNGTPPQPLFFTNYLNYNYEDVPFDTRHIVGCMVMGLAITLGSTFWHDLVKGLTDVRGLLKDVKPLPQDQLAKMTLAAAPKEPFAEDVASLA